MRVENTSPRAYGLSAKGFEHVVIPAAATDSQGTTINGAGDVDPEMLKLVKAESWGAAVFGCGDLVEVPLAAKPVDTEDAKPKGKPAK